MLPANHISNSAVKNYALPPEAAGPPGVSAYAPNAPGPRYDHVDFDALYSVGKAAFGPVCLSEMLKTNFRAALRVNLDCCVQGVMIGGGAATSFTELNRRSTYGMPISELDFVGACSIHFAFIHWHELR